MKPNSFLSSLPFFYLREAHSHSLSPFSFVSSFFFSLMQLHFLFLLFFFPSSLRDCDFTLLLYLLFSNFSSPFSISLFFLYFFFQHFSVIVLVCFISVVVCWFRLCGRSSPWLQIWFVWLQIRVFNEIKLRVVEINFGDFVFVGLFVLFFFFFGWKLGL